MQENKNSEKIIRVPITLHEVLQKPPPAKEKRRAGLCTLRSLRLVLKILFELGLNRLYLAIKKEEGYIFLSIAIGITVILALLTVFLANSASVRVTVTSDFIETTQSYYNAISGIEYAIEKMKIDLPSAVGTFEHANGTVQVNTSTFDYYGNPLTSGKTRFISTGCHGQTERLIEILVEYKVVSSNPPWGPISVVDEVSSAEFTIGSEFALNDSIFIGKSVVVEETVNMGDPPGDPTCIYVPEGQTVTGSFDEYFSWSEHPEPVPALPDFDHIFYDSLINIANSITSTGGNKYDGNLTIETESFDLSLYENSMYFVKGKVVINGGHITGGDYSGRPGILIASNQITCSEYKPVSQESIIDDNIIFIAGSVLEFDDASEFGADWSSISPPDRPATFNEVYAKDAVEIMDDAVVWALCTSLSDLTLDGKLYGVAHAPTTRVDFNKSTSSLEGALFTKQLNKKDIAEDGVMNLHHIYPVQFSTQCRGYRVIGNTWREI